MMIYSIFSFCWSFDLNHDVFMFERERRDEVLNSTFFCFCCFYSFVFFFVKFCQWGLLSISS
jgi:hypothetical protein